MSLTQLFVRNPISKTNTLISPKITAAEIPLTTVNGIVSNIEDAVNEIAISLPVKATTTSIGLVKPDNTSIKINSQGVLYASGTSISVKNMTHSDNADVAYSLEGTIDASQVTGLYPAQNVYGKLENATINGVNIEGSVNKANSSTNATNAVFATTAGTADTITGVIQGTQIAGSIAGEIISGEIVNATIAGSKVFGTVANSGTSASCTGTASFALEASKAYECVGNSSTSDALTTPQTILLTGDANGSVSFGATQGGSYELEVTIDKIYPTSFSWQNGTSFGPTGTLECYGQPSINFDSIPVATTTASGVVTNDTQTFGGTKTFKASTNFSDSITVKNKVTCNQLRLTTTNFNYPLYISEETKLTWDDTIKANYFEGSIDSSNVKYQKNASTSLTNIKVMLDEIFTRLQKIETKLGI